MDHKEVGRMWDENAGVWTELARKGCDVYRDFLNAPAFMAMLPEIKGLRGLDIGCGEGYNTRLAAARGARMAAIDVSEMFVRLAREEEERRPLGIDYMHASAVELPFADEAFDFEVATMSLMDIPEHEKVLSEAFRVLRPGGFLQFSICHPCFSTPRWQWVTDEAGERVGVVCGDYFEPEQGRIEEWIFGAASEEERAGKRRFRVPRFFRTLSSWLNLIIDSGFVPERFEEPFADEATARECPDVADTRHVAFFLIIRCRKPL